MGNVFDIEAVVRMLFFKLEEEDHSVIKPFLKYLNFMPKVVFNIRGRDIWDAEIREDEHITQKLNLL